VIHGEHQGHDVQTIRKSLPEIHEHFEALLHQVSQKIEEMDMQYSRLESKKREVNDLNQGLKHQVSSMFEELRLKIDAKERELMTQLDQQAIKS
jgi:predicted nuclease with TOPRIM domain